MLRSRLPVTDTDFLCTAPRLGQNVEVW